MEIPTTSFLKKNPKTNKLQKMEYLKALYWNNLKSVLICADSAGHGKRSKVYKVHKTREES